MVRNMEMLSSLWNRCSSSYGWHVTFHIRVSMGITLKPLPKHQNESNHTLLRPVLFIYDVTLYLSGLCHIPVSLVFLSLYDSPFEFPHLSRSLWKYKPKALCFLCHCMCLLNIYQTLHLRKQNKLNVYKFPLTKFSLLNKTRSKLRVNTQIWLIQQTHSLNI